MPCKKLAISVPAEVIKEVDRAAKLGGLTRSRFITNVLIRVASARSDVEITRRINEFFSDPEMANEQKQTARDFNALASLSGTEW